MLKIFLLMLSSLAFVSCASVSPSRKTAAVDEAPAANRMVNIAIGASVPATDPNWNITSIVSVTGGGPSRKKGGEVVAWQFFDAAKAKPLAVKVAKIRLIGYSAGGKGQVLVHLADFVPAGSSNKIDPLTPLYKFAAIGEGSKAKSYNGLVLLGAGDFVVYTPPTPLELNKLVLTLEAFANDDASVDVQLEFSQDPGTISVGFGRVLVSKAGGSGRSGGSAHGGAKGNSGGDTTPAPRGGCQFNGDCGDGFSCGMDGKCRASGGDHPGCQNGGACDRNGDCCSGDCHAGSCRGPDGGSGGPGDPCTYNTECYSHNCGAGHTCKAN